jgi:hypothetical protein
MAYELGNGSTHDAADHASERENDGSYEDCLPDALVELARAYGLAIPSSNREGEALRRAAGYGPTGGTSLEGLQDAFRKRYGVKYEIAMPAKVATVARPGRSFAIIGSMAAFGPTHRLSRWQRGFNGFHAWFGARLVDGRWIECDPLAPERVGYFGDVISEAQMQAYYDAAGSTRRIGWLESGTAITGGPNDPVTALLWNPTDAPIGKLTIVGDGHFVLDPTGAKNRPVNAGAVFDCYGTARLDKPYNAGPGDRQNVYIVSYAKQAYFVIFADASFVPIAAPPLNCDAAIAQRDDQWRAHLTPPK